MTGGRQCFLVSLALVVTGCQPLADFRTRIRFPAQVDVSLDSMHYQIDFRGLEMEAVPSTVDREGSGVVVEFPFSDVGSVMLTVWADLDGGGAKSPGDLVGQFDHPFRTRDAGLFSLGYSNAPDIVLEPWAPSGEQNPRDIRRFSE